MSLDSKRRGAHALLKIPTNELTCKPPVPIGGRQRDFATRGCSRCYALVLQRQGIGRLCLEASVLEQPLEQLARNGVRVVAHVDTVEEVKG